MTEQEIKDLRKSHDGVIAQAGPWGGRSSVEVPLENWRFLCDCNNVIERLLQERQKLLALAHAVLSSHPDWKGVKEVVDFAESKR